MMTIDNEYNIGEIVYAVTDDSNVRWMVTEIIVGMNSIAYRCSHVDVVVVFEEFEISRDKNIEGLI